MDGFGAGADDLGGGGGGREEAAMMRGGPLGADGARTGMGAVDLVADIPWLVAPFTFGRGFGRVFCWGGASVGGVPCTFGDGSGSGVELVLGPKVANSFCKVVKTSGVTLPLVELRVIIACQRKRGVLNTESISSATDPPVAFAALRISLTRR